LPPWARARLAESWTVDAPDELLRAAVDITRTASGLAAQRFLEGVPVSTKADGTDVTPVDIEVEELIRSLIAGSRRHAATAKSTRFRRVVTGGHRRGATLP
jgi:hypothetical protein